MKGISRIEIVGWERKELNGTTVDGLKSTCPVKIDCGVWAVCNRRNKNIQVGDSAHKVEL